MHFISPGAKKKTACCSGILIKMNTPNRERNINVTSLVSLCMMTGSDFYLTSPGITFFWQRGYEAAEIPRAGKIK